MLQKWWPSSIFHWAQHLDLQYTTLKCGKKYKFLEDVTTLKKKSKNQIFFFQMEYSTKEGIFFTIIAIFFPFLEQCYTNS